jgi:hypothetical protein
MSDKLEMLDQTVGPYNLARDLLGLRCDGATIRGIARGPKGYVILWSDDQGWTVQVRQKNASSIGSALSEADATQDYFKAHGRIGLIDPRIDTLVVAIRMAIGDCEMALLDQWNRDDEGFQAMRNQLQDALRKAGVK